MGSSDGLPGKAQSEEISALIIEPRLRRIQILRLSVAEGAAAECDRPAADVRDREHDPVTKGVVVPRSVVGPFGQAARPHALERRALLPQMADQGLSVRRGITEPEALDRLREDSSPLDILPGPAGLR